MTVPIAGRIDAHVHLWDLADRPQPWTEPFPVLHGSFGPDQLLPELAAAGIGGAVLVQCVDEIAETVDLLALAAAEPLLVGVVGWVDLTADVPAQLADLRARPGGERLVGIRHQVQNEPDAEWMARTEVRAGLAVLAEHDLSYDLIVRPHQLADALHLVKSLPQLTFVLDHGGKPPIVSTDLANWSSAITELAECPNLAVKISGLVTEAAWDDWQQADLTAVVDHLLATFGPQRCLFGSDWPVCQLAATYSQVVDTVTAAARALDPASRRQLWGEAAAHWYRLGNPRNPRSRGAPLAEVTSETASPAPLDATHEGSMNR